MKKKNVGFVFRDKIENATSDVSEASNRVWGDGDCERQDDCMKFKIQPGMDEKSFVRAAWICLAKMDAPLDAFDCDLDCIEALVHQVMVDTVTIKVKYEAVFSEGESESRIRSERDLRSTACVENGKGKCETIASEDDSFGLSEEEGHEAVFSFDSDTFLKCLENLNVDSVVIADSCEAEEMKETENCMMEVGKKHNDDISSTVKNCFGDEKYQVVEYDTELIERNARIFMAPEYHATINYKGNVYALQAFRFGNTMVLCDKIENARGLKAYEFKKQEELEADKKKIRDSSVEEKKNWSNPPFVFSVVLFALFVMGFVSMSLIYAFNGAFSEWNGYSIGMLAGAIVASVLFIVAFFAFVMSLVRKNEHERMVDAKTREYIDAKEKDVASDIENYSASYKTKQLEILNEKLASLDLALASPDELL